MDREDSANSPADPPPPPPPHLSVQNPKTSTVVTKFHALRPPAISIQQYLERINKYAGCSPECFVLALVYIDLLISRNGLTLTSFNIHRVIITAVMLAAKFFDDHYYNNAYYARVGGLPCSEINALELEMLFSCGFSLHISSEEFEKYFFELAGHCLAPAPTGGASGEAPRSVCDCASFAPLLDYAPEELRYTKLRPDFVQAAKTAAVNHGKVNGGILNGGGTYDTLPVAVPTPGVLGGGAPISLLGRGTIPVSKSLSSLAASASPAPTTEN
jgi:hypothetical protein